MSCEKIIKDDKTIGYICFDRIYKVPFKGKYYYIEIPPIGGPIWLKSDLTPRKNWCPAPNHPFWRAVQKLENTPIEQREQYEV